MTSVQLVAFIATTLSVLNQMSQAIKVFRTQDLFQLVLFLFQLVLLRFLLELL
ncbi:MAG: hypothetical protein WCK78_10830 [Paludibacter sp.]